MDAEIQARLREKFSDDVIGKLPRVTCPKCRDSRTKSCDEHQKQRCALPDGSCGGWMTPRHIHLSYVGHAAVTDRLLGVDPSWTWEPLAFSPDGLPQFDKHGGLWIRLTVAGVTRMGYGDADGKQGPDGVKGAVSDALRNGAMRFGVGLDLWHKDGELHQEDGGSETGGNAPSNGRPQSRNGAQNGHQAEPAEPLPSPADRARADLLAACEKNGWKSRDVAAEFSKRHDGADLRTEEYGPRITAFTKLLPDVFGAPAATGAQT